MLSGIHLLISVEVDSFCYRLTLSLDCKVLWKQESYDLLTLVFGNLPEVVLTATPVWSDSAELCEDCWQVRKLRNTHPVLAWTCELFLNLSVSGKGCQSDLDGDCRLASLQRCGETGSEARVAYRNVISIFLFDEPTFLHSSALEGCVLSYCKWL